MLNEQNRNLTAQVLKKGLIVCGVSYLAWQTVKVIFISGTKLGAYGYDTTLKTADPELWLKVREAIDVGNLHL